MRGVYIIAEAGSNHLGKVEYVRELVRVAKGARAQAIKFQAFNYDDVWEEGKKRGTPFDGEWWMAAVEASRDAELDLLCTPFSVRWVPVLAPYVSAWKISASHVGDKELLDACAATGKPIMVSTAFLRPECIYEYLCPWGATALHCVHAYPASPEDYAMDEWVYRAGLQTWGLSDHSPGYGAAACAVAKGASIVEKHFKLKNQPPSPDDGPHALTPSELASMVALLGDVAACRDGDLRLPRRRPGLRVWLPDSGGW